MVFLENFYKPLLIIHLFAAFVLLGSMTHHLFIICGFLRNRFDRKQQEKFYMMVSFLAYMLIYLIGAVIYPAFVIHIRCEYFDKLVPQATRFFEIKEHWSAIGLALFIVCWFLRKNSDPETEKDKLFLYIPICFILNLIVWFKIISGSYLTILRGS